MGNAKLWVFAALSAFLLAGCGVNPQTQLDRYTSVYVNIGERAVELREPCVLVGPEDPGCVLDDAAYAKFRIIQTTVDGYIKAAEAQIELGEEDNARFYLKNIAGSLIALADRVGMSASETAEELE